MKILFLTVSNHIYGNIILKKLIESYHQDIIAVIESNVLLHKKSYLPALWKYLKISGLRYFIAQSIKHEFYKITSMVFKLFNKHNPTSIFYSFKALSENFLIPVYSTKDINCEKTTELMKNLNPDLVISVFFNQILGKKLLEILKNCINIHPSYLPNYKGVSPVFWVLANDESYTGVSVHFMDDQIDRGHIIYQEKISISPNDSEHKLYIKCCERGVKLLQMTINDFKNATPHNVKSLTNEGSYFSIPTRKAVKAFKKNKKKFFRLSEFK